MSVAAGRVYAPVVRARQEAMTAEFLENQDFGSFVAHFVQHLATLASRGMDFDPSWERERLAEELTKAHDFLTFLCTGAGAPFMAKIQNDTPALFAEFDRARTGAATAARAHAAACALVLGTDAALRDLDDADLENGARMLAHHNPLFECYANLTPEHVALLDSFRK